eukprot:1979052-Pyramimonas_sp.AAC.1
MGQAIAPMGAPLEVVFDSTCVPGVPEGKFWPRRNVILSFLARCIWGLAQRGPPACFFRGSRDVAPQLIAQLTPGAAMPRGPAGARKWIRRRPCAHPVLNVQGLRQCPGDADAPDVELQLIL